MAKKKAKTKTKPAKKRREISLKKTVADLDRATQALRKVRDRAEGEEKQDLTMKLEALAKVREEMIVICHGFPLWVSPPGKRGSS